MPALPRSSGAAVAELCPNRPGGLFFRGGAKGNRPCWCASRHSARLPVNYPEGPYGGSGSQVVLASTCLGWSLRRQSGRASVFRIGQVDDMNCSFCNKGQEEVRKLIAGPKVYICDECIELCNDIIAEEWDDETSRSSKLL